MENVEECFREMEAQSPISLKIYTVSDLIN